MGAEEIAAELSVLRPCEFKYYGAAAEARFQPLAHRLNLDAA
jgi:hypothetical protein